MDSLFGRARDEGVEWPGIPYWGSGTTATDLWWGVDVCPEVYTSRSAEPGSVGIGMNNAWWAASTVSEVYAVYADDSAQHRVRLVARPSDDEAAWWTMWPVVHTGEHGSTDRDGNALGYPCPALRSRGQGDVAVAFSWRGATADSLWVAHGGPESGWDEVNVSDLALRPRVSQIGRHCLAMDEALNTWLVFSAFDGRAQRIYLAFRPAEGEWTAPTVLSGVDDFTEDGETYSFDSVDFPSVAVSGARDPNGPTVLVVYSVTYYDSAREVVRKRVLGRAARVADVAFAATSGWRFGSFLEEVDVGGSGESRDPCVAAARNGTFVVVYSWPNSESNILARHTVDPVSEDWSRPAKVCPDDAGTDSSMRPHTQGTQNFASISVDEVNQRCFVCWEDTSGAVTRSIASSNGAVAELADLASWTALGILTRDPIPRDVGTTSGVDLTDEEVAAVKNESTRYPCVVATAGAPRIFCRAVADDRAALRWRTGRWM